MSHGVRGVLVAWLLVIGTGLAGPERLGVNSASSQGTRSTEVYRRIKAEVNQIPLIDTHDHPWPFELPLNSILQYNSTNLEERGVELGVKEIGMMWKTIERLRETTDFGKRGVGNRVRPGRRGRST
jgi:hypothetical protein